MNKLYSLLLLFSLISLQGKAQNMSSLFTNVDTIYMPGAASSHFTFTDSTVQPIISNSFCASVLRHYAVARPSSAGKVIAIGHEALLSNNAFNVNDNAAFILNAMNWLNSSNKNILLKNGWINNGNTSSIQTMLTNDGYSFSNTNNDITAAALAGKGILILGNDWNGNQPYTAAELTAIDNFVSSGGSVFIAGLGWSWPNALADYPMNQVANLFGIEYTTTVIYDPTYSINGTPLFHNFYPNNVNPPASNYCPSPYLHTNFSRGDSLRVLRLAVSVNGEFTQQNGGVSAVNTILENWLDDINELYGRELCMRFELIPNNNLLIFDNASTDPWGTLPPGSGGCTNANIILYDQANIIDSIIGAANYDISHVIVGSPFGGGCAGGLKSGVSGGFNIPVTRHEMGHQFAQSHTINHNNNVNYEPENGAWTIHGGNSKPHFHAVSFHQTANMLKNSIANVGTKVPTGNTIPTVSAGQDYTIPISTPFTLTGTASDPDNGDSLTYVWDNMNPGDPQFIPVPDDSQGALFMRLLPDTVNTRTFPKMSDVIANNNSNAQEQLPTQARVMDIRLSVHDHHKISYNNELIYASGVNSDDVQLTVASAGPFEVTSQNTTAIVYQGLSTQTISWNVNGTDLAPIGTQTVSILLSVDGGYTYPYAVLQNTPNTGSAQVVLPNLSSSTCRFKVAADNNIYFDLNTEDFEIQLVSNNSKLQKLNLIQLQPNPANTFFSLNTNLETDYQLLMTDLNGRNFELNQSANRYDISRFPSGVYLVTILDQESESSITKKLIIQR